MDDTLPVVYDPYEDDEPGTEIEPLPQVFELMDPQAVGTRRQMLNLKRGEFPAFPNDPDLQQFYEDYLAQMLLESEQIPGLARMADLAAERLVYLYGLAEQRRRVATRIEQALTPELIELLGEDVDLGFLDLDSLQNLTKQFNIIFKSLNDISNNATTEEVFRNSVVRTCMNALRDAVERHLADDRDLAIEILMDTARAVDEAMRGMHN